MDDSYQKRLEADLKRVFRKYKKKVGEKARAAFFSDFRTRYRSNEGRQRACPLVTYTVRGGSVTADSAVMKSFAKEKDDRASHTLELIKGSLDWCRRTGLACPDTDMHVWISDRYPYFMTDFKTLPVFVYARPMGVDMPVLPDNTFTCLNIKKKYAGQCHDWDAVKKMITDHCADPGKGRRLFFKGVPSTEHNSRIRERLEEASKKSPHNETLDVSLDAFNKFEPVYSFCKHWYHLNLPGRYPWSNRLRYVLLMGVVVNVRVALQNISPKYSDERYIQFVDYAVDERHYVPVDVTYYRADKGANKKDHARANALNDAEFERCLARLTDVRRDAEAHPAKYAKMASLAKSAMEKLTMDRVYAYVYRCLLMCSKLTKSEDLKKN